MATLILLLAHVACRQISVGLYLIKYTLKLFGLIIPMKLNNIIIKIIMNALMTLIAKIFQSASL